MGTEPSSWVCQVHAALEKDDTNDDPSQLLIWKVPVKFRTNAEHYEPLSWRLQLTGERWDTFCKGVVQEPKSYWEAVYGQSHHVRSYTIEEIRCLLSLDALFLVVYLQEQGRGIRSLSLALQKVMEDPVLEIYLEALWEDYLLVENQIPMELLKRAVGTFRTDCREDVNMQEWEDVQWQGLNIGNCVLWRPFADPRMNDSETGVLFKRRMEKWLQHADSYHGVHILDSVYRMLCGKESLETPHNEYFQYIGSAILFGGRWREDKRQRIHMF